MVKNALIALLLLFPVSMVKAEISDEGIADNQKKIFMQMEDDELSAALLNRDVLAEKLPSGVFLDRFIEVVVSRPFYKNDPGQINKQLWDLTKKIQNDLIQLYLVKYNDPQRTIDMVVDILRANLQPMLSSAMDAIPIENHLVFACDTLIANPRSINRILDNPREIYSFKLLESLIFNPVKRNEQFKYNGCIIDNLPLEMCQEYLAALDAMSDGIKQQGVNPDFYTYKPVYKLAALLIKYVFKPRIEYLSRPQYIFNRVTEKYWLINGISQESELMIKELKEKGLWRLQRERVFRAAFLLGTIQAQEAVPAMIDFLAYDTINTPCAYVELELKSNDIVRGLVLMGAPSLDPLVNAYVAGNVPVECTAYVVTNVLPSTLVEPYLKSKGENDKIKGLISKCMELHAPVLDQRGSATP